MQSGNTEKLVAVCFRWLEAQTDQALFLINRTARGEPTT